VATVDTGWYLRGYLGMSNQFFNGLDHPSFLNAPLFGWYDKGGFDSAPFGGVASAIRRTTGCVSMSPVNIAARPGSMPRSL